MKIKTQFQINISVAIGLAIIVAGILFYADRRIDAETEKNFLADQISKSVFELFMVSNTYLTYREERPRMQWDLKLASLKKLINEAKAEKTTEGETLQILSQRCDEMGALFEKIVSYPGRLANTSGEEAALIREAHDRLTTSLIAKGQEMVNYAFLLIQESNRDLSSVKKGSITLVMVSILLAIAVSILISILLSRRILTDLRLLQKGTEIVAGGNLDHRVDIERKDEIGQLAIAFNEMTRRLNEFEKELEINIERLAQSNRDLQDFAFVASHDLQEPLRKIQAFGDRLKEKQGAGLSEEGRDYLERMQNAAVRMQTLIQALLTYSWVTTRPEPFSPGSLATPVREAKSNLAARIEQTGAQVEVGHMPVIESSPHQMQQLFQNLLSNSLKYRSEKKPVIKVTANHIKDPESKKAVTGGQWVRIFVEDNGIGFDEKYLDRIFQPFQRLHVRSEYEGTGMGLAICRKIVERHGGTITAKSVPGKGTTFIITLPVSQKRSDGEIGRLGDRETKELTRRRGDTEMGRIREWNDGILE
jgi:signal transduction histidine kinase